MNKYQLSHILVKYEYEAQDILKKIQEGKTFEEMAQKYSTCSSSKQGGFLGEFRPGRFVESFEEAVEKLSVDQISKPIKTQFGYHIVIKTSK